MPADLDSIADTPTTARARMIFKNSFKRPSKKTSFRKKPNSLQTHSPIYNLQKNSQHKTVTSKSKIVRRLRSTLRGKVRILFQATT